MQRFVRVALVALVLGLTGCATPAPPPAAPPDPELVYWESIGNSRNPAEYRAYLDAYPQGRFAGLARVRIEALSPPKPEPARKPPPKPAAAPPPAPAPKLPPAEQQGEATIVETPAPPATWARVEDSTGLAGPRLRSQFMDCWTPPALPRGSGSLRAEIRIYHDDAGRVIGAAFSAGNGDPTDPVYRTFLESALSAAMSPACRTLDSPPTLAAGSFIMLYGLDSPA